MTMEIKNATATQVVKAVRMEQDHGLRCMWRTPSSQPSNDTKPMPLGSPRLLMEVPSPEGRRARQSRQRSPWSCSIPPHTRVPGARCRAAFAAEVRAGATPSYLRSRVLINPVCVCWMKSRLRLLQCTDARRDPLSRTKIPRSPEQTMEMPLMRTRDLK
jgi:hypothetical protein